jgi:two-component system chemotaxis sensor kinase CheA
VDELLGQQQFVAKSLGDGVGKVQGVSGGAILGDGRVGLILDPSEIASLARQNTGGWGSFSRSAA